MINPSPSAIRLLIAEPEKEVRESLAFVLGAMDGARVVHAAATADDVGRWLSFHPRDWDVALVDEQLVDDVTPRLRNRGGPGASDPAVLVLCDAAGASTAQRARAAEPSLGFYDKRRDIDRITSLCMHLRDAHGGSAGTLAG